jgi:hypothetical protein
MLEEPQIFAEKLKAFLDEDIQVLPAAQSQPSPVSTNTQTPTSVTLAP